MYNRNSKSESNIVKQAENIIDNYLRDREVCDIKNYYNLKEKYERLKILSVAMFITTIIGTLLSVIF